jgi:hypothetical protein
MFDHVEALLVEWAPMKWCAVLCHRHEWPSAGGDIRHKGRHTVNQAYELLNVIVITGGPPVYDAGQLARIRVDSLVVNDVAQAIYTPGVKIALGPLEV